jgi:uncharacterized repeat protein (TIGR01451 family)
MKYMPIIQRYSEIKQGALIFTGNTLGLSKENDENLPGTAGSIGGFTTIDTTLPVPTGWESIVDLPGGDNVTLNWQENSSSAELNIPAGSTILHAELIWGGSSSVTGEDVSAFINGSISFTTPDGTSSISPRADTTTGAFEFPTSGSYFYERSADVTALIQTAGSGTYTVGAVPATLAASANSANNAGWTLAVAYENPVEPFRQLYIGFGGEIVTSSSPPIDLTFGGFVTPSTGAITARILLSAQEGDANITGDMALFGPDTGNLTTLSGPNNPDDNFFASQINIGDSLNPNVGEVDLNGTFGNRNHDAFAGDNIVAGRQGYDITNVDGSATLINNQTSAVLRLTTAGDAYLPNAIGIQVSVQGALVELTKSADKNFAEIGDTITYTIVLDNIGEVDALNVIFNDIPPTGTTYVAESFQLDGSTIPGADPSLGVSIGNVLATEVHTVTFDVIVDDQIVPATLSNSATADYEFIPAPGVDPIGASTVSNIITTGIESAQLDLVKSVDKGYAKVGDLLTYTIDITNTGTVEAQNVIITDNPPNGTIFSLNSVFIDGLAAPGEDPSIGINLGNIASGGTVQVVFSVEVTSLPVPNPTINTASGNFDFQLGPTEPIENRTSDSNPIPTQIEIVSLDMAKTSNKTAVAVGDTIIYSIVLNNTGTVALDNVVFTDVLVSEVSYVAGSFSVDGVSLPGADPTVGVNIGSIVASGSVVVSYEVVVDSLPNPPQITNTALTDYEFTLDPQQPPETGSEQSNANVVQVEEIDVTFSKTVDKSFVELGDNLTYTFDITNSSTIDIDNVVFTDIVPVGTSFIPGTFTIDTIVQPTANPNVGVNLGTIVTGTTLIVTFQVSIDSIPSPPDIINTGTIDFQVQVDPTEPPITLSETSNPVTSEAVEVNVDLIKSVDKDSAKIGDTLTYTVNVSNTGTVTAQNVLFTDIPPNGTTFIENSVLINGMQFLGADPSVGINLGNIPAGAIVQVVFQVDVTSIPVPNPTVNTASGNFDFQLGPTEPIENRTSDSNEISTQIERVSLEMIKTSNKSVVTVGETIKYSIELTNTGTVSLENVIFSDVLAPEVSYVTGSFSINGVPVSGANLTVGVNIGSIDVNENVVVSYEVVVNSLPSSNQITNVGVADYEFKLNPQDPVEMGSQESNVLTIDVELAQLKMEKIVDKEIANIGDILNYTLVITNIGTVSVDNVILTDVIPEGASFVTSSVKINGVSSLGDDPEIGINVGTLASSQMVVITFEVIIDFVPCPPTLINQGEANFEYNLEERTETFTGNAVSNEVSTDVGLKIFKQISVDGNLQIPIQKPDAEDVLEAILNVSISETFLIKTPVGESYEGQILTGWKLIIKGKLSPKIKYVADEPTQSVHVAHYDTPFSTFLVLPPEYEKCKKINVNAIIEDVFIKRLDERTFFMNVTLLVEGKVG